MISVMVIAENPIVRAGLESILSTSELLTVVGSSSGISAAVGLIEERLPDVVVLDWGVPDDEPVAELLAFSVSHAPAQVILVNNPHSTWVESAVRVGVRAILPPRATEEIVAAVIAAAAGLVVLHPEVVEDLLPLKSSARMDAVPIQALTPREIEVLGMLVGMANKAIAKELNISEHTVKFHVSSIFQKLNASTRTEAVALGARLGLIML